MKTPARTRKEIDSEMQISELLAGVLIERLGVRAKPDLPAIASRLGMKIREVDSEGFDGALVRAPGHRGGVIAVKASLLDETRKRFVVAHEIGHFVLPGHGAMEVCSANHLETWGLTVPKTELEANEFAAELLLPTKHVRETLAQRFPDLSAVRRIASEYETSLTTTTRKFLRVTDHACAMVWSTAGQIVWSERSEAFTPNLRLGKLDPSARASELLSSASELADNRKTPEFEPRPSRTWLKSLGANAVDRILECSVFLPHYNSVLTLLWIEDMGALRLDADDVASGE